MLIRSAGDGHIRESAACRNGDLTHRGLQYQVAVLRGVADAEAEGHGVAFDDIAGDDVARAIDPADADHRRVLAFDIDVGDRGGGGGALDRGGLKVAAVDGRHSGGHGLAIHVGIGVGGGNEQAAGAAGVERHGVGRLAHLDGHAGFALRSVRGLEIERYAGSVLSDVGGTDGDAGDIAIIDHVRRGAGAGQAEGFEVAAGGAGDGGGNGAGALDVVLVGTGGSGQVGVGITGLDDDWALRGLQGQVALRGVADAEAEGHGVAFDDIAGDDVARAIDPADADHRRVLAFDIDVGDRGGGGGALDRGGLKVAAVDGRHSGGHGLAIHVGIGVGGGNEQAAGAAGVERHGVGRLAHLDGHAGFALRSVRGLEIERYAGSVLSDVGGTDGDAGDIAIIDHVRRGAGAGQAEGFEVAAGGASYLRGNDIRALVVILVLTCVHRHVGNALSFRKHYIANTGIQRH